MRHIGFQRGVMVASGPSTNSPRDDMVRLRRFRGSECSRRGNLTTLSEPHGLRPQ